LDLEASGLDDDTQIRVHPCDQSLIGQLSNSGIFVLICSNIQIIKLKIWQRLRGASDRPLDRTAEILSHLALKGCIGYPKYMG
jgi:hypothetical protein